MGVVIPVGEFGVALRWSVLGDPEEMITTMGVRHSTETDPGLVAVDIYNAATGAGSITPVSGMNQGWTFVGVTVTLQDDPGQSVAVFNNPITATVGGLLTLPQNVAFLVHKRTALSGRQNRGRFYVPPYPLGEGDVDITGTINSGAFTTLQNRWNVFYANLGTSDMDPVLFHSIPVASTPITAFVLDTRVATQRGRLRR